MDFHIVNIHEPKTVYSINAFTKDSSLCLTLFTRCTISRLCSSLARFNITVIRIHSFKGQKGIMEQLYAISLL